MASLDPRPGQYSYPPAVHGDRFLIGISGKYLATDDGGYPTLFERASADTCLGIDFLAGTTDVHVANDSIEVALPGSFEYCTVKSGTPATVCDLVAGGNLLIHERCDAPDHWMALVRK